VVFGAAPAPKRIVETSVTRGLTTRVLLEALVLNGGGLLWSIDLPPLLEHRLAEETGAAVPEPLHERWTMLRGSSRRLLRGSSPVWVRSSSSSTTACTRSETFASKIEGVVAPALAPGGAALIDDVERNVATGRFLPAHPETPAVISTSGDGVALIACLVKPGNLGSETER
jgi:hypothetical protein